MASNSADKDTYAVPKTEKDITDEWIAKVVGMTPLPGSTSVVGNIQDGVGFLSNLCRVVFETEKGRQHILVKLLPTSDEFRALTRDGNFDEREILFYTLVQPKILQVAPALEENMCKFYCGKAAKTGNDYASMVVLEDLKPLGYKMYSPFSDGWERNLENVMKFLAQFHCASLDFEKHSNSKLGELFPFCLYSRKAERDVLLDLALVNMKRLDGLLEENNCSLEIRETYKEMHKHAAIYFARLLEEGAKNPCLIHGDLWPPNIMVADDESPVKIIDWQTLAHRDPTVELSVVILTSLPKSHLTRHQVNQFCKVYMDTCDSLGKNKLGRSREEFKTCFNTWGLAYSFFWFLLSMDAYPGDNPRLSGFFEFLQQEYKICQIFKVNCSKMSSE